MRTLLNCLNTRSGRLFGLAIIAAATVVFTADTAAAKRCRKGGGSNCGGCATAAPSYGCNTCGSANVGYHVAQSGCGSCGGAYAYAPVGMPQSGCGSCGGTYAYASGGVPQMLTYNQSPYFYGAGFPNVPATIPQMAMNMPQPGSVTPASGTTSSNYGVVQASGTSPANHEMGLRIVQVDNGPAQTAGIQQGAVIVSVDGRRVHNFDELRNALQGSQGTAKVTFVDANGQRMTKDVNVQNHRLGVSVVESPVSMPAGEERTQDRSNNRSDNSSTPASGTTTPNSSRTKD